MGRLGNRTGKIRGITTRDPKQNPIWPNYNISPTNRFPWNKVISLTKPPVGVRSCEVAIIWPDPIIISIGWFNIRIIRCHSCSQSTGSKAPPGWHLYLAKWNNVIHQPIDFPERRGFPSLSGKLIYFLNLNQGHFRGFPLQSPPFGGNRSCFRSRWNLTSLYTFLLRLPGDAKLLRNFNAWKKFKSILPNGAL